MVLFRILPQYTHPQVYWTKNLGDRASLGIVMPFLSSKNLSFTIFFLIFRVNMPEFWAKNGKWKPEACPSINRHLGQISGFGTNDRDLGQIRWKWDKIAETGTNLTISDCEICPIFIKFVPDPGNLSQIPILSQMPILRWTGFWNPWLKRERPHQQLRNEPPLNMSPG